MRSKLLPIILILLFIIRGNVQAQEMSIGIAKYFPIPNDQVEDGDLIGIKDYVYGKTTKEYDIGTVGVVTLNPAVEINDTEYKAEDKRFPIISEGTAYVKTTVKNGDIKKGDILTTSDIPGVAMKSTRPGFAIGIADMNFIKSNDPNEVKRIPVVMHLHYSYSGDEEGSPDKLAFTDIFAITKLLEYQSPSAILKYLFAAFVIIVSIVFGYFTFARIAARGIEAVGRNPLASKAINLSIVVNVAITVVIVVAGLTLAYVIIIL